MFPGLFPTFQLKSSAGDSMTPEQKTRAMECFSPRANILLFNHLQFDDPPLTGRCFRKTKPLRKLLGIHGEHATALPPNIRVDHGAVKENDCLRLF